MTAPETGTHSLLGLTQKQRSRLTGHVHYVIVGLKILRQDLRVFQTSPLLSKEDADQMEALVCRITDEILFLKVFSLDQYRSIKRPLMEIRP